MDSPQVVAAIIAAAFALLGNIVVVYWNSRNTLAQEQQKANANLHLEQEKARYSLVLQAMATNDAEIAKRNVQFFIDAELLHDPDGKISEAIDRYSPVLPSPSGTTPIFPGAYSPVEIARLYNFPTWLDGRGQTIGILEFSGSIGYEDLASYFSMLNLPVPDVASISVAGGREESDFGADGQVMMDIEIAAAIAPRARIRVYFAPWGSAKGWQEAINRASADRVSVFVVGWGQPEIEWKDSEMRQVNTALQQLSGGRCYHRGRGWR
jgi:subtilase family serine protease